MFLRFAIFFIFFLCFTFNIGGILFFYFMEGTQPSNMDIVFNTVATLGTIFFWREFRNYKFKDDE